MKMGEIFVTLSLDTGSLVAMATSLLLFGIAFNAFVAWLERRPCGHRGFTSLLVAIGVGGTLVGLWPLVGLQWFLVMLLAFVASGTPMIVGSIARYFRERDHNAEVLARDAELYIEQ